MMNDDLLKLRRAESSLIRQVAYGQFQAASESGKRKLQAVVRSARHGSLKRNKSTNELSLRKSISNVTDSLLSLVGVPSGRGEQTAGAMSTFDHIIGTSNLIEIFASFLQGENCKSASAILAENLRYEMENAHLSMGDLEPRCTTVLEALRKMTEGKPVAEIVEDMAKIRELVSILPSLQSLDHILRDFLMNQAAQSRILDIQQVMSNDFVTFCIERLNDIEADPQNVIKQLTIASMGNLHDPDLTTVIEFLNKAANTNEVDLEQCIQTIMTSECGTLVENDSFKELLHFRSQIRIIYRFLQQYEIAPALSEVLRGERSTSSLHEMSLAWPVPESNPEGTASIHPTICRVVELFKDIQAGKYLNPRELARTIDLNGLETILGISDLDIIFALEHAVIFSNPEWRQSSSLFELFTGNLINIEMTLTKVKIDDLPEITKLVLGAENGPLDFLQEIAEDKVKDRRVLVRQSAEWFHALHPGGPNLRRVPQLERVLQWFNLLIQGNTDNFEVVVLQDLQSASEIIDDSSDLEVALADSIERKQVLVGIKAAFDTGGEALSFIGSVIKGDIEEADIAIKSNSILAALAETIYCSSDAHIDELCSKIPGLWPICTFFSGLNGLTRSEVIAKLEQDLKEFALLIDTSPLTALISQYRDQRLREQIICTFNQKDGPLELVLSCLSSMPSNAKERAAKLIGSIAQLSLDIVPEAAQLMEILNELKKNGRSSEIRSKIFLYEKSILSVATDHAAQETFENARFEIHREKTRERAYDLIKEIHVIEFLASVATEEVTDLAQIRDQCKNMSLRLSEIDYYHEDCTIISKFLWEIAIGEIRDVESMVKELSFRLVPQLCYVPVDQLKKAIAQFFRKAHLQKFIRAALESDGGVVDLFIRTLEHGDTSRTAIVHQMLENDLSEVCSSSIKELCHLVGGLDDIVHLLNSIENGLPVSDAKSYIMRLVPKLVQIVNEEGFYSAVEHYAQLQSRISAAYHAAEKCGLCDFFIELIESRGAIEDEEMDLRLAEIYMAIEPHIPFKDVTTAIEAGIMDEFVLALDSLEWLPREDEVKSCCKLYNRQRLLYEAIHEQINVSNGPKDVILRYLEGNRSVVTNASDLIDQIAATLHELDASPGELVGVDAVLYTLGCIADFEDITSVLSGRIDEIELIIEGNELRRALVGVTSSQEQSLLMSQIKSLLIPETIYEVPESPDSTCTTVSCSEVDENEVSTGGTTREEFDFNEAHLGTKRAIRFTEKQIVNAVE